MPDTGAPWNIPYADPTDLVRDWPDLSEDVADAVALGLTNAVNAGIGSNVVSANLLTHFTTTSTSFVDPGLSVTITPTSASSKILVIANMNISGTVTGGQSLNQLFRDATAIAVGTEGTTYNGTYVASNTDTAELIPSSIVVLDSPATTSAVTYEFRVRSGNSAWTATVNRRGSNTVHGTASSITAIEVAA